MGNLSASAQELGEGPLGGGNPHHKMCRVVSQAQATDTPGLWALADHGAVEGPLAYDDEVQGWLQM